MSYSSEVLADSPQAYYRLGEASGTTMTDSSGNSRNGTYNNTPTLGVTGALSGDTDTAATFAVGSSEDGRTAYGSWLDINTSNGFTVEAWVKTTATGTTRMVAARNNTSTDVWHLTTETTGKPQLFIRNTAANSVLGPSAINDGNWHHVVGVWDGSNLILYVDGSQVATTAANSTGLNTTASQGFNVGSRGNLFFDGSIDEVAYYSTALSATRIGVHYTEGHTAAASGSGSLSLSASGTTSQPGAGAGDLTLSGTGAVAADASGAGSLDLSATGGTIAPEAASGAGAIDLAASGAGAASASGTGALDLAASGTALAAGVAAGTGSIDLTGSGSATLAVAGAGTLELTADGEASPLYVADTSNALDGLDAIFEALVTVEPPVVTPPPTLALATKVDKAISYPDPVIVNGRPT